MLSGYSSSYGQSHNDALKAQYRRPAEIPFPSENPYTPEKSALGKALYFDPRLSGAQNTNCATCHNPSFGWEVPVKTAVGAQNKPLDRQAPAVLNQAGEVTPTSGTVVPRPWKNKQKGRLRHLPR